jgi:hypothetical protein
VQTYEGHQRRRAGLYAGHRPDIDQCVWGNIHGAISKDQYLRIDTIVQ